MPSGTLEHWCFFLQGNLDRDRLDFVQNMLSGKEGLVGEVVDSCEGYFVVTMVVDEHFVPLYV